MARLQPQHGVRQSLREALPATERARQGHPLSDQQAQQPSRPPGECSAKVDSSRKKISEIFFKCQNSVPVLKQCLGIPFGRIFQDSGGGV